jgi:hypothetical protein
MELPTGYSSAGLATETVSGAGSSTSKGVGQYLDAD